MKKKKNAFTLIELLAIIVILAIIAVITVPIILNIIENSRKGAASDSAYGYKDSVNKYYLGKLAEDSDYILPDGTYTVNGTTGYLTLDGSNPAVTLNVQVAGTIPSSGKLRYTNNLLDAGCLVFGEYEVTFGTDGKTNGTEKGDCSTYQFPNPYETKFDGTYTYTTIGQFEENENGFVPVEFNNEWTIYLRNDGTKNEVCKVFPNGTVCLAANTTGYYSDQEGCTADSYYYGPGETCLKGYTKAKVDEMFSKGADYCFVSAGEYTLISDSSDEYCVINVEGQVACYNAPGDSDSCLIGEYGAHCD